MNGLPPSSSGRTWWANNSRSQALAWREAGYHVDQVYLERRRVRFALGQVGGTYRDKGRNRAEAMAAPPQTGNIVDAATINPPVDVRVCFRWLDSGEVSLDAAQKLIFGSLQPVPGLYRMSLSQGSDSAVVRVYIGETDNLRRRLTSNYRNPGSAQQTSLRIKATLRDHLASGGSVALATMKRATCWLDGVEHQLDLSRKSGRLLAENAALVQATAAGAMTVLNLG